MINLMITAIGGDVASATLRCIRKHYKSIRIVGCDIREYNQGIMYVDAFFKAPAYTDIVQYREFIFKLCKSEKITHFWPMTEYEIRWADKHRELFKMMGIELIINNSEIINIASSKLETSKRLKELGLKTPRTVKIDQTVSKKEIADKIGFPLILKMDSGCGSKGLKIVFDESVWECIELSDYHGYVAQEYIGSAEEEYTVGVFSDGMVIKSIIFKRQLGYGGLSTEVITVENRNVEDDMCRLANALKLRGSFNVQMRKKGDVFYIFEINPRISSTVGFRDLLGFRDAIWWLKIVSNEECDLNWTVIPGKVGVKVLGEKIL